MTERLRLEGTAMSQRRHLRVRRAAVAVPGATLPLAGATVALWWGSRGAAAAVSAAGEAPFDALLAVGAAIGGWLVLAWLTAALILAMLASATSSSGALARLAAALAPVAVRRLAALLLGLSLAPAGALPAYAVPSLPPPSNSAVASTAVTAATMTAATGGLAFNGTSGTARAVGLDRPAEPIRAPAPTLAGWSADRPARVPKPPPGSRGIALVTSVPHQQRAVIDHVVVRRGDSLWRLVSRHLGPSASAAEIAAEWPRWYAANRSTVGPDPDLIRPGQLLRVPNPDRTHSSPETP